MFYRYDSPYYPDGTFCGTEKGVNLYCQRHDCLPENAPEARSSNEAAKYNADNIYLDPESFKPIKGKGTEAKKKAKNKDKDKNETIDLSGDTLPLPKRP